MLTNGLIVRSLLPEGVRLRESPESLVIALFRGVDGAARAEHLARNWQPLAPGAEFLGIQFEGAPWTVNLPALQRGVAEAAAIRGLEPSRAILLGWGETGRFGLELVLCGVLPALGIIAYDIPLPTDRISPLRHDAALRLVQQASSEDPVNRGVRALIRELQNQDLDVRAILLPEDSLWADDMPTRAGSSFLVELVARASANQSR